MRKVLVMVVFGALALGCGSSGGGSGTGGGGTGGGGTGAGGGDNPCANHKKDTGETDIDCGGACGPCADGKGCAAAADCTSAFCGPGYVCWAKACNNGTQDPAETGLDCGGTCPLCAGDSCAKNEQCTTGFCKAGVCDQPSCTDGIKNGKETGADCGGDCPQCADGQGCMSATDCANGFCNASGQCATPSCTDQAKNGKETGIDCGGASGCAQCPDGQGCDGDADCSSGKCTAHKCGALPATCNDGQQGQDESDVDCGGSCALCGHAKACAQGSDCKSGICDGGQCGEAATCADATLTPGETDIDCGGDDCAPCALGKTCKEHVDCLTLACVFGVCEKPTCDDGAANGAETDVDCGGGECPKCPDSGKCKTADDCTGGLCTGGFCGGCEDGVKNGAETDVDCGGNTCGPCATGQACGVSADCETHVCANKVCASCEDGIKNGNETDVDCGGGCPTPCAVGKGCTVSADCELGACGGGTCCQPNACGGCGDVGQEFCNGLDDDCDGQTDEDVTPEPCENQQGVCKGSVGTCMGEQGWACGPNEFSLASAAYESSEDTCDGQDNDCNGQVDELSACALCSEDTTVNTSPDGELVVDFDWFELWKGEPVAAGAWGPGADKDAYLVHADGSTTFININVRNGPGLAVDGSNLYVAMRLFSGLTQGQEVHVFKAPFGDDNLVAVRQDVPNGAHATPIGAAAGTWGFVYVDNDGYTMRYAYPGSSFPTSLDNEFDNEAQIEIDYDGQAHIIWRESFGESALVHWTDNQVQTITTDAVGVPDMAVDLENRLHVVYVKAGEIYHQRFSNGWSEPQKIASTVGVEAAVAASPDGFVYAAWRTAKASVGLARWNGASWETLGDKTILTGSSSIKRLEIKAKAHGVVWVGAVGDPGGGTSYFVFSPMCAGGGGGGGPVCTPSCLGKSCGDDGCGGSCGSCFSGQTCQSGQCVGGGGGDTCGADPANTCSNKCGGYDAQAGCNCDDQCAQYNDCCSDLAACCP